MRQGTTETAARHRTLRKNPEQAAKETDDAWANAPWFGPYTMEEINARIAKAEADMEAGLGTPHEEFMDEMEEYILSLS